MALAGAISGTARRGGSCDAGVEPAGVRGVGVESAPLPVQTGGRRRLPRILKEAPFHRVAPPHGTPSPEY